MSFFVLFTRHENFQVFFTACSVLLNEMVFMGGFHVVFLFFLFCFFVGKKLVMFSSQLIGRSNCNLLGVRFSMQS